MFSLTRSLSSLELVPVVVLCRIRMPHVRAYKGTRFIKSVVKGLDYQQGRNTGIQRGRMTKRRTCRPGQDNRHTPYRAYWQQNSNPSSELTNETSRTFPRGLKQQSRKQMSHALVQTPTHSSSLTCSHNTNFFPTRHTHITIYLRAPPLLLPHDDDHHHHPIHPNAAARIAPSSAHSVTFSSTRNKSRQLRDTFSFQSLAALGESPCHNDPSKLQRRQFRRVTMFQ